MSIERSPISKLRGQHLIPRWPTQDELNAGTIKPGDIVFTDVCKNVRAFCSTDDLFDAEGNRFWLDA